MPACPPVIHICILVYAYVCAYYTRRYIIYSLFARTSVGTYTYTSRRRRQVADDRRGDAARVRRVASFSPRVRYISFFGSSAADLRFVRDTNERMDGGRGSEGKRTSGRIGRSSFACGRSSRSRAPVAPFDGRTSTSALVDRPPPQSPIPSAECRCEEGATRSNVEVGERAAAPRRPPSLGAFFLTRPSFGLLQRSPVLQPVGPLDAVRRFVNRAEPNGTERTRAAPLVASSAPTNSRRARVPRPNSSSAPAACHVATAFRAVPPSNP